MARFLLQSTNPMLLKDAPQGMQLGTLKGNGTSTDPAYKAGRLAFARGCIACHSSIQPGELPDLEVKLQFAEATQDTKDRDSKTTVKKFQVPPLDKVPADWNNLSLEAKARFVEPRYNLRLRMEDLVRLTRGDGLLPADYQEWAQAAVEQPDFWKKNYLSTDMRIPVTLTRTNSARAMATNGIHGHMWEDFASETYKELDPVGWISYRDPFSGAQRSYQAPGGGRGYYRVPSLIGIWATAPFLHNNALGKFNNDPSVKGRLDAFDDALTRLLWPEKRLRISEKDLSDYHELHQFLWPKAIGERDPKRWSQLTPEEKTAAVQKINDQLAADGGLVWRTSEDTWLTFSAPQIPVLVAGLTGWAPFWVRLFPWLPSLGFIVLGVLFLLAWPLTAIRERLESGNSWLEWLIAPFRWLIAVAALVLAGVSLYYLPRFWPMLRVLDAATDSSFPFLRTQVILIPIVFLLSFVVIAMLHRLPQVGRAWRWIQGLGVVCLVLALLAGISFGRFMSGNAGDVHFGPIPGGVPVNVLANTDPDAPPGKTLAALGSLLNFIVEYQKAGQGSRPGKREFEEQVAPAFMQASRCPDFVMDRGHDYIFMRTMSDADKRALSELLKTF